MATARSRGGSAGETALINQTLARQLAAREGDEIILRVRKPSALGLDAAISPRNEDTVALRLKVGAILTADMLGDFALAAQPAPPANLFLPWDSWPTKSASTTGQPAGRRPYSRASDS